MNKISYFVLLAVFCLAAQPLGAQQRYGNNYNPAYRQTGTPSGTYPPATPYGMQQTGVPYGLPRPGVSCGNGQYVGSPYAPGYYNSGYNYGQYPYANQPGYGYYGANPYASSFPALGAPVPCDGGLFRFNVGGFSGAYWKSPSGYYYPWGAGAVYTTAPPVIVVNQGSTQPALPPVSDMLRDMSTYVDEQNSKKKFKTEDYQHLARRLKDLQSLESSMRSRNGGTLDQGDEEKLRKDCAMVSGDISRRVIP